MLDYQYASQVLHFRLKLIDVSTFQSKLLSVIVFNTNGFTKLTLGMISGKNTAINNVFTKKNQIGLSQGVLYKKKLKN